MSALAMFEELESAATAVDKTLVAADLGLVHDVTADGKAITLPAATVAGAVVIVRNAAGEGATSDPSGDGTAGISVLPAGTDQVVGNGFTAANGKGAVNTKATARYGDFIMLQADGTSKWNIVALRGIWARVA